jgi:hypothetical protein
MRYKLLIAVVAATTLLSACSESQSPGPLADPETQPTTDTLSAEDRAAVDAMGADFQALNRVIRSAYNPRSKRQYATERFETALATATAADLVKLERVVEQLPPSPIKDATEAKIDELRSTQ